MSDDRDSRRAGRTEKELASESVEGPSRSPKNPLGTASRRKARSSMNKLVQQGGDGPRKVAPLLVASAFVALAALAWQHFRRKRPSRGAASLLEKGLRLPNPVFGPGPRSLRGLRVVCSASFDLAHIGSLEGGVAHPEGLERAALLDRMLDAGAALVGRSNTEELHLGLLGEAVQGSSPAAPLCIMSGTSSGIALLVANGMADVGLGLDHLAGIRVQAAMNGICSFRPSQNVGALQGVARVTESLDAVGWVVRDPALLPRIAEALKISGGAQFSKTDLFRLVIGSEVFDKLGEEGMAMERIALKVAKKWAGSDYVATGSLISFLKTAVPSAQHFLGYDNDSEDVLEGIRRAAVTLQHWELLQLHGHLLENPDELLPSILEQLTRAQDIGEEEVQAAEEVARETREAMRSILKGSMLILPSLPCRQPLRGSEKDELKQWERGALQLAALSTFSGCPQANIAIHQMKDIPPLGLSILSLVKTDQQLANVASALAPLVDACAQDILSPPGTPKKQEQVSVGGKRGGRRKEQPSAEALAEEQELKEAGNASFKAGKYDDAIAQYTLALRANATNAVLFSNRAQAFIKLGRFEEAEEDCNKGLRLHLNAKTLLRRGTARAAQGNTDGAQQDFKQVLAIEPANRQAKVELQNLQEFTGLDRGLMV